MQLRTVFIRCRKKRHQRHIQAYLILVATATTNGEGNFFDSERKKPLQNVIKYSCVILIMMTNESAFKGSSGVVYKSCKYISVETKSAYTDNIKMALKSSCFLSSVSSNNFVHVREDIKTKNTLQFGHCPNVGGGVYPCPNFFDTFLTN